MFVLVAGDQAERERRVPDAFGERRLVAAQFVGDNERDRLLDVGVRACVLDGGTEGMPRPRLGSVGHFAAVGEDYPVDASYIRRLRSEKVWLATSVSLRCP